jgi:cystathionine gamma-synthase
MATKPTNIETLAVHAGHHVDPATGAVAAPIHLATTFQRDPDGSYPRGHVYSRASNPARNALEEALAALEGGNAAAAFASGQAATTTVFQSLAPGDHVIAPDVAYYGTGKMLREVFALWGLQTSLVDMTDASCVAKAMRPNTKLVWMETPANPMLSIVDIQAVAEIARAGGAKSACDNTWATPVATRPLDLGCDIVMHSTTKYLGGHSDVMGGALVMRDASDPFFERLRLLQTTGGAVASPFDCWLVLRGIRTLPYRVRAHSEHAAAVAEFLAGHPAVECVNYPGLATHPGHEVAARQMRYFGGMLSVQIRGDQAAAMRVVARCELFTRATSLGGVESLIEHRASQEPPDTSTPRNLLRVSVGLEHPDDLIADLRQALA